MIRPIRLLRARLSGDLDKGDVREILAAEIEDLKWAARYKILRSKCILTGGHDWEEHLEYEDAGYPVHVSTWQQCSKCEHYEELWNIYD